MIKSKYQQIVDDIITSIDKKELKTGAILPSINQLSNELNIAKDTVVKAYKILKNRGIIESKPAVGFYVASESTGQAIKVMLLMHDLKLYQEILYNSFINGLKEKAVVDVYFHHCNDKLFETIINDNLGNYGMYVVVPFQNKKIPDLLKKITPEKLLIIDRPNCMGDKYSYISQNFEKGIYDSLATGIGLLKKYKKLNLVFPKWTLHPKETVKGFKKVCKENSISCKVINHIDEHEVQKENCYLFVEDNDMINAVKQIKSKNYAIGKDVGIISYNDTPMKEIIGDGITVISTDFAEIGKEAAKYVLSGEKVQKEVKTSLIKRESL